MKFGWQVEMLMSKEKGEIPGVGWFAGGTDTEGNIFGMLQPPMGWRSKAE